MKNRWMWLLLLAGLMVSDLVQAQQADFVQLYTRGKVLLQQRLYLDGIKELKRASVTARGQTHFGVHYYIAVAYFKLSSIQMAGQYLDKGAPFAKNGKQKAALKKLRLKLKTLYGRFRITPQVDPDDVGRLRIKLTPKSAFSNKYKAKFFKRLAARLKKNGIVPNNKLIYLPKGEYDIEIQRPQCLQYGFFSGAQLAKEMNVGESTLVLSLQQKKSCNCDGGRVPVRKGKKIVCECPANTAWNEKNKRCQTGKFPVMRVALITSGAVLGTAAIVVVIAVVVASNTDDLVTPVTGPAGVWK